MNQAVKRSKELMKLINLLFNGGDTKDACKSKKVLKNVSNEPFIFNLLGVVSASIGSYEEAINFIKEALKINPQY